MKSTIFTPQKNIQYTINTSDMEISRNIKRRMATVVLATLLVGPFAKAEAEHTALPNPQGWYVGIDGGMPFGFSTFSSFGHDKTRAGYSFGAFGGYRFNAVLSAEATARYAEATLSAQDCCTERGYWLGSDGKRYQAGILDKDCWEYGELKSRVKMRQYGARLNVNVLGMFRQTVDSRWAASVSPHVYAIGTKADIRRIEGGKAVKTGTDWHLGYGADLQIGYQAASFMQVSAYSGITWFTGKQVDGMPEHLHKNNFVWETGIRLGFSITRR